MFLSLIGILIYNPYIYIWIYICLLIWIPHKIYIDYFFAIGFSTILLNFPVHYDSINNFKKILYLKKNNLEISNIFYKYLKLDIFNNKYYISIYIVIFICILIWSLLYRRFAYRNKYLTFIFLLNLNIAYLLDQNRFYLAACIYIYANVCKKNILLKLLPCFIHEYFIVLLMFRLILEKIIKKYKNIYFKKKEVILIFLLGLIVTATIYGLAIKINSDNFIFHKIKAYTLDDKWGIFSLKNADLYLVTSRIIDLIIIYLLGKEIFRKENNDLLENSNSFLRSHVYFFTILFFFNTFYQRTGIVLILLFLINFCNIIKNKKVLKLKKIVILVMFFIKFSVLSYVSINLLRKNNDIFLNHKLKIEILKKIKTNNMIDYFFPDLEYSDKILQENINN